MPSRVYKWKRFWCPRSGSINLFDGGYLCDPDSEWGKVYNPQLVTLEAISHLPCLVLLGEPGIGKTQALKAERSEIVSKIKGQGDQELFLDLRSYRSEDRLIRSLFNSSEFTTWEAGTHQLHIFLDSLDECLLRIDTLSTLLVDEFKRYHNVVKRLCIRIACRTAVWPPVLEEGLKEIWGENSVGVYELALLRRVDVMEAARAEGFSPDDFIREVGQKNVVPLAIKPVTLKFLLNAFRRHNSKFSANQKPHELYLEGCRLLCEEVNQNRRGSNRRGNLDIEQRLIVAARIAAVTIFVNRFAVWNGVDWGDIPDEDVLLLNLCYGYENANGREFEITEAVIEEVLDTGLFSSRGLQRMGWAHQTYAEFLAAWYLKQHQLKLPQILKLIVHSDNRVVPQLHETVTWLASMNYQVFHKVMETDPDVLLQSDLVTIDKAVKAMLVESLLKLHDQDKILFRPESISYGCLNHSGLPAQLQLYISDSTRSIHSRYTAIDIAEACNVQAVQSLLADVAINIDQPYLLRRRAASALVCVGDQQIKMRLKCLAVGSQDDLEDDLKGYALQAVYPTHMTTEEVLSCLTQPKGSYFGGCYQDFVAKKLGCRLLITDLPVVLKWLLKSPIENSYYPFVDLADAVILKAWEHLDDPEVLSNFAQLALQRLSQYDEMIGNSHERSFKQLLEENDSKRRQLLEAVISAIPNSEKEPLWLSGCSEYSPLTPLKQDFLWLIEKLQLSDSNQIQRIYAKLICWELNWYSAEQISLVFNASQNNSILRAEFSSRADQARLDYIKSQEMLTLKNKQKLLDPLPKIRVLECLSQFEAGSVDAWWRLCREMTLIPTSTHYNKRFESDISILPGWQEADEETKSRIIAAAKKYVEQGEPETETWLGTNSFRCSALAGYKALRLLSAKDPNFISIIAASIWRKWAAIILAYPNAREDKDKEIRQRLIKETYQNAPNEFIRALIILIDHENSEHSSVNIICELRDCWDGRLVAVLAKKVQDKRLTAKSLGNLLKELLINQVEQAKVFAESLIPIPLPTTGEARAKSIVAAKMLILYTEDFGWSVVWSAIQQDPKFGREVLEVVSNAVKYEGNIEQRLGEDNMADLYIFLVQQYPDLNIRKLENYKGRKLTGVGLHMVGPEDNIRTWRNHILQRLQERGTPEASAALRKIIHELPELKDELQWKLLEAEAITRRQTWHPLQPEQLLQLVGSQQKNQSVNIQTGVLVMQGSDSPNFNISGSVGAVNVSSTVNGSQIGTQHNYASEQSLVEAFDEIQQIFNRLTQTHPTLTDDEKQLVVIKAVEQVKQNPTLMKRVKAGGRAFIFEALQKASDQWWVSPFVKAIEAGIKEE